MNKRSKGLDTLVEIRGGNGMSGGKVHVLVCRCKGRELIKKADVDRLVRELRTWGSEPIIVLDRMCSTKKGMAIVKDLLKKEVDVISIACYPNAQRAIFNRSGKGLDPYSLREEEVGAIIKKLKGLLGPVKGNGPGPRRPKTGPKERDWFPVIDYTNCNNCGDCHDFCLFGVYEFKDRKVVVSSPSSCKEGCPACARFCPRSALIFPKCKVPWIAGSGDPPEDISLEDVDVNLDLLLGSGMTDISQRIAQFEERTGMDLKIGGPGGNGGSSKRSRTLGSKEKKAK